MSYGKLAGSLANSALDVVPGGKLVKNLASALGLGGGPPDAKSVARLKAAAGRASLTGSAADIAFIKQAEIGSKYSSVRSKATTYLNNLKAMGIITSSGAGPMAIASRSGLKSMGHVAYTPDGQYVPYEEPVYPSRAGGEQGDAGGTTVYAPGYGPVRKRRKKRRKKKARSKARSRKRTTKRKGSKRKKARKLKFGSPAYRKKYLGHK